MAEVKQDISLTYRGWGQLIQTNNSDEETSLTFPLNETKTYSIANSENSDLKLPAEIQSTLLLHVDKNGLIEIENTCTPSSNATITLNENELKTNEKIPIDEKMIIKIGNVSYAYHRLETPGSSYLKNLFGSLQCAVCCRFLENPQSLPCHHIFCQSCVRGLLQSGNPPKAAGAQPYLGLAISEAESTITCPVCRKVNEAVARPQKVLSEVTKQFQEMIKGRSVCAMCQNHRWLMHASDYYFCETCQNVLCPLCALDMHRSHKLRSTFESMLQASRDFVNKTATAKQEWADILKQVEDNKSNIKETIIWIDALKDQLKRTEQWMDEKIKISSVACDKVQSLQSPLMVEKVETERVQALENFVQQVDFARKDISSITDALNAKINVINHAQKEIKVLIAKETVPNEKTAVKKTDTPK